MQHFSGQKQTDWKKENMWHICKLEKYGEKKLTLSSRHIRETFR